MNEENYHEKVERSLRRGNINFDFLNPTQLPDGERTSETNDRRTNDRTGKRGLFYRGMKPRVMSGSYTGLAMALATTSVVGLISVWNSNNFIALLAIPFLMSAALASLIMLGLFLARPR